MAALMAPLLLAGVRPAAAQLADWASISVPSTATVQLEQSYTVVRHGQTVYAFSCLSRTWTSLTVSQTTPSVTITNDHFIVQDGPFFYGYSPRTGRFNAQLAWSPTAQLVPRVSPQTWFSIVTDGNNIHIFQALEGNWTTYVLQGPPTVAMGTKCALVTDGISIYGVSAFYGTPVALPAGGTWVLGAYGNVGIATSVGTVYGFAAYRNTWSSMAITSPPTVTPGDTRQAAFVEITDSSGLAFFSGHTGTFTDIPATATAKATLSRAVAIVADQGNVFGYSGLVGGYDRLVLPPSTPPVTVTPEQFFALVDDGTSVRPFSATTGTFGVAITARTADITTRAEMAYHQPATAARPTEVYSQFLNHWTPTPSLAAATPYITAGSVVLAEPNGGLHGLSMHGTQWKYQATPPLDNVFVGSSRPNMELTLVAQAGTTLWAFNQRTQAWRMTNTVAPITTFRGNNTALITIDGTRAYGFSNWTDHWSSIALTGPVVNAQAQVQSAYVQEANAVHAYAGIGQLSTSHDYPEYWRAATQGSRVRIDVAAEPGSHALLAVSLGAISVPVPPHGTLLIDPSRMLVLATPGIPGVGLYGLSFQVPVGMGVRGFKLHFQAAVFVGSTFYFTNAITSHLL